MIKSIKYTIITVLLIGLILGFFALFTHGWDETGTRRIVYKSGCMDSNACDYDPLAREQGTSCVYAWYQTGMIGDKIKKPPFSGSDLTPTATNPPSFSEKPCKGCTSGIYIATAVVFFDGRIPSRYESSPQLIKYASAKEAAKFSGKNACKTLDKVKDNWNKQLNTKTEITKAMKIPLPNKFVESMKPITP
jgi:hypothetical protein